jgi:RNA polymerase sigma-70 factor (ECF subfamily)
MKDAVAVFFAELGVAASREAADELLRLLREGFALVAQRWPTLPAPAPATIAAAAGRRLRAQDHPPSVLSAEGVAELTLACACAAGSPAAFACFEASYFPLARAAVAKLGPGNHALIDEVEQALRLKLFVAQGSAPPRVMEYAGDGNLGGLIRVAATRAAIDLQRGARRERASGEDEAILEQLAAGGDPELDYLKRRYRQELREAIEHALRSLEPRERILLRMHLVDRLNIDELGKLHGAHRATTARWLRAIRERVGDEAKRRLRARLGVDREELDSMLRLLASQLDASFERVLAEP